jgi:hypothetical protein
MPSGGRSSSAEASSVRSRQAVRLSSGSTSVSQAVSPTRHMPADATSRTGMLLPVISRNRCKDGLFPSEGREFEPRPPLWKASLDTTSSRPRRSWGSSARPSSEQGRRDLSHRRLHRPAPRGARGPALARCGLRRLLDPRSRDPHARGTDDAEVRSRPPRADGSRRRGEARASPSARRAVGDENQALPGPGSGYP